MRPRTLRAALATGALLAASCSVSSDPPGGGAGPGAPDEPASPGALAVDLGASNPGAADVRDGEYVGALQVRVSETAGPT